MDKWVQRGICIYKDLFGNPTDANIPWIWCALILVFTINRQGDELCIGPRKREGWTTYLLCQQGVERRITMVPEYREARIRGRYNKEVEALFLGASDGGKD